MSEMAKKARAAMKEKAQGRAAPTKGSVDASGWTEPTMNTTAKLGMRPLSRRQFKKGGRVEGEKGIQHAGKAPRKGKNYGGEMGTPKFDAEDAAKMAADAKMRAIIKADAEANAPIPRPRRDRIMDRLPTDRPFAPEKRGGRTGRKNGGKAPLTADSLINRDVKEANEERGYPHTGGYKKGGMAYAKGGKANDKKWDEDKEKWVKKKPSDGDGQGTATRDSFEGPNLGQGYKRGGYAGGGYKKGGKVHEDAAMDKKLIKAEMSKHAKGCTCKACGGSAYKNGGSIAEEAGTRPTGGRMARKSGGRAKGKTNIHINIIAGKPTDAGAPPPPMGGLPGPMPRPPMPVAPLPAGGAGMPPMGPPPAPMGGGLPPGLGVAPPAMGPMARKAGGRVYRSYKDMDAGAGGGLGRLEKTEIQKNKK